MCWFGPIRESCFNLLVLLFLGTTLAYSQPIERPSTAEIPLQSVYVELGGNALIYSLNYDVLFPSNWGIRLGTGFYPHDFRDRTLYRSSDDSYAFLGLVMGTKMLGKTAHKIEVGTGLLFGRIYDREEWDFIEPPGATFTLGYRLYPAKPSYFTFKAAFTPVITRTGFHPRFGVSFGITLTPEGDAPIR